MDERCSDDDTAAEVSREEVDVERDVKPGNSLGNHGKEGQECRNAADDEYRRNTCSKVAIVFIAGLIDVAGDLLDCQGCEVGGFWVWNTVVRHFGCVGFEKTWFTSAVYLHFCIIVHGF